MVDAVLLEWDGVLADTGVARRDALQRAMADEGVPLSAAAYDACCEGLDVNSAATAALAQAGHADPTMATLVAIRASRWFSERIAQGLTLQPGATSFVAAAAQRSRVAIVTRASRTDTELVLRLSDLDAIVTSVITVDDVLLPPPATDLYDKALRQLSRVRPMRGERTVAVVSTAAAIRAAREAGIRTVAIGVPAHVAMEADAAISTVASAPIEELFALAGVAPVEGSR
jgi:beta-phosphoglucomutase-like phosphatase (HAD superfamily)